MAVSRAERIAGTVPAPCVVRAWPPKPPPEVQQCIRARRRAFGSERPASRLFKSDPGTYRIHWRAWEFFDDPCYSQRACVSFSSLLTPAPQRRP
jgi:hypothetical protein